MAKRELIDREKAENITWEEPSYTDALNVLTEVRDKIRELPAITEQDIVKPVLDKIREEVESIEHYGTNNGNDFWLRTPDEIKKDVLAILDKYMSESAVYITKAFDTLAGVVMKYQKIQEIVKLWREVGLDYDSCDAMENIERVIDNGNDN